MATTDPAAQAVERKGFTHRYTATCPRCGKFCVTYYPKLQKSTRKECRNCFRVVIHKLNDLTEQQETEKWQKLQDFIDKGEKK